MRPVNEADDPTTFMCRMSWKSWSLNLLEPSGPHRACYGTAFLYVFQILVLWPDEDPCLGSKLVAVYIKLFTIDFL